MKDIQNLLILNNPTGEYTLQIEEEGGKEIWIVPVVMIVEGVHDGSRGPILYTTEELEKSVSSWNNIPIVINHPKSGSDGIYISIQDGEDEKAIVGRITNPRMEGTSLKVDARIDSQRLLAISTTAYNHIRDQEVVEVSIGALTVEEPVSGEFNNEQYRAIARQLIPDHLALLPHNTGACNWDDGCGVRNKQNEKGGTMKDLKKMSLEELINLGKGPRIVVEDFAANEAGFREIMNKVQMKLDQLDNSISIHYLEELFDDHFVYRIHSTEGGRSPKFYRRDYVVQQDDSVEFTGEPAEVRKDTTYPLVALKKMRRTIFNKKTNNSMENKKGTLCDVDALIANEGTQFTEENREWLITLEADQLALLAPPEKDPPEKKVAKPVVNDAKVAVVKVTSEEMKLGFKELLNEQKDPEKFINDFYPDGPLKEQQLSGLRMYKEKRTKLIEGIVANKQSKFSKEALVSWSDENLENLHVSLVPEQDYSVMGVHGGNGIIVVDSDDQEEIGAMVAGGVETKKEEK